MKLNAYIQHDVKLSVSNGRFSYFMDFVFETSKTNICEECKANFTQFIALKSYTYVSIKVVVVGIWKSLQFAKISSTRLIEFERKWLQFW